MAVAIDVGAGQEIEGMAGVIANDWSEFEARENGTAWRQRLPSSCWPAFL